MNKKRWILIGGISAILIVVCAAFITYSLNQNKLDEEGMCNVEGCEDENTGVTDEEMSKMEENVVELSLLEEKNTGNHNNKDYKIKLFQLSSKSTIVKDINDKLKTEYNNIKEDKTEDALYQTICLLKQNGSLVSFMVKHSGMIPETSFKNDKYFVYLFDLKENKMVPNERLYALYNTTETEVLNKLKSSISDNSNADNLKIDQAYIDENDKLTVIYKRVLEGNVFYYTYVVE